MRVMLLVTDLQRGGTPLRLARLARGLAAEGLEVHVGCLAPPGPVSADLDRAGIATFSCYARHARDWDTLKRLIRRMRSIRPHLIHATLTHANVAARLAGVATRVPVLTSTATIELERRWHRWAELLTSPLDRGHIVNSQTLAGHVARAFRISERRIHVVPPSIEIVASASDRAASREALAIPEHEFVVLWAGRFDPVKRIELVVKCAEIMGVAATRFLLAGDGPHRLAIEQTLRLSSAARSVHLLGWRDDLPALMSAADAFLFPSLTEGMPNAVLQAMAAGLPVVASDVPTLRELSGDEHRLILVAGAEPKPFADVLMELHHSAEFRRSIGGRAAEWAAANLDPRKTVQATIAIYESVSRRRVSLS